MSNSDSLSPKQFGNLATDGPRLKPHNADLDDHEPDPLAGDMGTAGEEPGTGTAALATGTGR